MKIILKGGTGSGHYGHEGREGERGGSLPGKGGGSATTVEEAARKRTRSAQQRQFTTAVTGGKSSGIKRVGGYFRASDFGRIVTSGGSRGIGPGSGPEGRVVKLSKRGVAKLEDLLTKAIPSSITYDIQRQIDFYRGNGDPITIDADRLEYFLGSI